MRFPDRYELRDLTQLEGHGFDEIIDVRTPLEFADDHLPGAINLPVLSDEERVRVGTIYKQESPFLARKIGAALVARNAAHHIEHHLADRPGGWRPLVHCWRGGQRSGSFALILSQIGWRVSVLEGGYKAYRQKVIEQLYDHAVAPQLILLDGNTGTAKTAILERLAAQSVQVMDLEGLANHRGSIFGAVRGGQPSQRQFESRLAAAISRLDPERPVLVEAESSKIGALRLPPKLWAAMKAAPRIEIQADLAARAEWLQTAYADILADRDAMAGMIGQLRPLHPAKRIEAWLAQIAAGEDLELAAGLMREHYDPRYARHRGRSDPALRIFDTQSLTDDAQADLAGQIAAYLVAPQPPTAG